MSDTPVVTDTGDQLAVWRTPWLDAILQRSPLRHRPAHTWRERRREILANDEPGARVYVRVEEARP